MATLVTMTFPLPLKINKDRFCSHSLLYTFQIDDAKAACVSPNPPCSNCTPDQQLQDEDSFPVSSYLTWTCNDGFTMEGDADAVVWVCGINGKWLGDEPNCTGKVS